MASLKETSLTNAWNDEHIKGKSNANNCSGFIHSVLKESGVTIPTDLTADRLVDYFDNTPTFKTLGTGSEGLKEAFVNAKAGKIVIVGAKSSDLGAIHGHVALIMGKGDSVNPYIYGGSIGKAQSRGTKTLSQIFRKAYFPKLKYFLAP